MRIFPTLLLAAGLAAAAKIPVLSEPRSLPVKWQSYNSVAAWGDTLFDLSGGKMFRYVRAGSNEILLDSIPSGWGSALLKSAPGTPYSMVTVYDDSSRIAALALDGSAPIRQSSWMYLGNIWAGGGWVNNPADSQSTNPEVGAIVCGDLQAYRLRQGNPGAGLWIPDDSLVSAVTFPGPAYALVHGSKVVPASMGLNTLCDIDAATGQGVIALVPDQPGTDRHMLVGRGNAWNLLSSPLDSVPFTAGRIFSGWSGQWLATTSGGLSILRRTASGGLQSSTIENPGYSTPMVKPVRRDSLVVFAIDSLRSSLVLAKWTSDTFAFMGRVELGAPIPQYGFMATGDSVLWVQTDSNLISFRISWQEAPNSSIEPRSIATRGMEIFSGPQGTGFLWNGSVPADASIIGLDGRMVDRIRLTPGRTTWWRGSRSGLFLARTPDGSSKFVVK